MPIYEYRCRICAQTFELLRPMRSSDEPAMCPKRHAGATRVISLIAARSWETNAGPSFDAPAGGGCACSAGGPCACAG